MATALLLPRHYPALFTGHSRSSVKITFPSSFDLRLKPNPRYSPSSTTSSASSSFPWDHEEKRWLREEQRWIREEQRWIREEIRWRAERESLLLEISSLRLRLKALDGEAEKICPLLAEAETVPVEEAEMSEKVREGIRIPEGEKAKEMVKERETLKMGSKGEDVREMQEALLELGFFSGEDDMEYSDFSGGTERAVKTWQASLGIMENGIMTSELLDKLFVKQTLGDSGLKGGLDHRRSSEQVEINVDSANGAPVSSLLQFKETQEAVIKDADDAQTEMSGHRVYLLGENRWEEPSRLRLDKSAESGGANSRTQCLTCRGEGKVLCTECDGSGEPNVEPQFLEWIGEGTKCPYCEGLGYIICDVCN